MSRTSRIDQIPFRKRRPDDYNKLYAAAPPWEINRPQSAFVQIAASGAIRGKVLDAGCGSGEHALMAASMGLNATGIDSSAVAIESAKHKAKLRGLHVRFELLDAADLGSLAERFDTVLDSGLFHALDNDQRAGYVNQLHSVVTPTGRLFILCFSDLQPGTAGPRRITQSEIHESFKDGWRIDAIEAARIDTTAGEASVAAWCATIART